MVFGIVFGKRSENNFMKTNILLFALIASFKLNAQSIKNLDSTRFAEIKFEENLIMILGL